MQKELSDIVVEQLTSLEDLLEFSEEIKMTSEGMFKGRRYKAKLIITLEPTTPAAE